jgi:excisionase family DNA binding protein
MNSNVIQIASNRAVYTVMEVAELLSLSRGTTYTMIRAGQIPAKKIGNRWVVPKTRFHAWLDDLPEASWEDVARALGLTTEGTNG